ncbi:MAG: hypothetical protein HY785_14980 [Oscillatoriophycideae cyanobacterium NC_groundwater_1537_Pr4_S-0.65um_50_18]|nr:hypothetical protein [Oscillatoriophycideae cyanobacterium NC_groundwater_1537_Pr4_S-0.65um_50_18]
MGRVDMGASKPRLLTLLGYGAVYSVIGSIELFIGSWGDRAIASAPAKYPLSPSVYLAQNHLAQNFDSGCRQTNAITGIYEQPNLDSASRGILPMAQTVRLEVLGTGTGWARINQPVVGWIEARYLMPNVPCNDSEAATSQIDAPSNETNETQPRSVRASVRETHRSAGRAAMSDAAESDAVRPDISEERSRQQETNAFPEPNLPNLRSTTRTSTPLPTTPSPNTPNSDAQVTTVSCDVLPSYGLIVRSEPSVMGNTYITTIPVGTYSFQFTRNTQTNETPEGIRRWVYITSPVEGWISLGYVGKDFNLGGQACG